MGIDSRDLIEERETLKQDIIESFNEKFSKEILTYEEVWEELDLLQESNIEDFKEYWEAELDTINEIDNLENNVIEDWHYGAYLIAEDDFEDYVKELLEDTGYIPKNFPSWIEIDWESTANNVKTDYISVMYKQENYLVR